MGVVMSAWTQKDHGRRDPKSMSREGVEGIVYVYKTPRLAHIPSLANHVEKGYLRTGKAWLRAMIYINLALLQEKSCLIFPSIESCSYLRCVCEED